MSSGNGDMCHQVPKQHKPLVMAIILTKLEKAVWYCQPRCGLWLKCTRNRNQRFCFHSMDTKDIKGPQKSKIFDLTKQAGEF